MRLNRGEDEESNEQSNNVATSYSERYLGRYFGRLARTGALALAAIVGTEDVSADDKYDNSFLKSLTAIAAGEEPADSYDNNSGKEKKDKKKARKEAKKKAKQDKKAKKEEEASQEQEAGSEAVGVEKIAVERGTDTTPANNMRTTFEFKRDIDHYGSSTSVDDEDLGRVYIVGTEQRTGDKDSTIEASVEGYLQRGALRLSPWLSATAGDEQGFGIGASARFDGKRFKGWGAGLKLRTSESDDSDTQVEDSYTAETDTDSEFDELMVELSKELQVGGQIVKITASYVRDEIGVDGKTTVDIPGAETTEMEFDSELAVDIVGLDVSLKNEDPRNRKNSHHLYARFIDDSVLAGYVASWKLNNFLENLITHFYGQTGDGDDQGGVMLKTMMVDTKYNIWSPMVEVKIDSGEDAYVIGGLDVIFTDKAFAGRVQEKAFNYSREVADINTNASDEEKEKLLVEAGERWQAFLDGVVPRTTKLSVEAGYQDEDNYYGQVEGSKRLNKRYTVGGVFEFRNNDGLEEMQAGPTLEVGLEKHNANLKVYPFVEQKDQVQDDGSTKSETDFGVEVEFRRSSPGYVPK